MVYAEGVPLLLTNWQLLEIGVNAKDTVLTNNAATAITTIKTGNMNFLQSIFNPLSTGQLQGDILIHLPARLRVMTAFPYLQTWTQPLSVRTLEHPGLDAEKRIPSGQIWFPEISLLAIPDCSFPVLSRGMTFTSTFGSILLHPVIPPVQVVSVIAQI